MASFPIEDISPSPSASLTTMEDISPSPSASLTTLLHYKCRHEHDENDQQNPVAVGMLCFLLFSYVNAAAVDALVPLAPGHQLLQVDIHDIYPYAEVEVKPAAWMLHGEWTQRGAHITKAAMSIFSTSLCGKCAKGYVEECGL